MTGTPVLHKYTLRFRNGKSVTGSIQSSVLGQNCPVLYAGEVDRLPYRIETADHLLLQVMFRSFARELHARFEQEEIGTPEQPEENWMDYEGPPEKPEREIRTNRRLTARR